MHVQKLLLALSIAAALAACGGGSDGPAATPPPPPVQPPPPVVVTPPPYTLAPAVLSASYVAGYPTTLAVEAKQTVPFTGIAYLKVVTDGPFEPNLEVLPEASSFKINAKTSATAKPGRYTGNITVSVCPDPNCATHLAGSPFKYPYDIEVRSAEASVVTYNLKPLAALADAPDWATFQGNIQHTGYVPVSLSPAGFSERWAWFAASPGGVTVAPSTVATGAGRVYSASGTNFRPDGAAVFALSEHDGSIAWSYSLSAMRWPASNPPAYANGRVYASAGSQESTTMLALDAANGSLVFQAGMHSQWEHYLAPIVVNGVVYSEGGSYGGLYAFDAVNGKQLFFQGLPQYDSWSPAYGIGSLYGYVGGALQVIDPVSGAVTASIPDPHYDWNGYSTNGAPVIGASGLVFAGNLASPSKNAIVAFNPATRTVAWSVKGDYAGNPAYADGTVFTINNATGQLDALAESDGAVRWSWRAPEGDRMFAGDPLVTNNLVFVSTRTRLYAIDRNSHEAVWTFKASGKLAISANGTLYVTNELGIRAINLH